MSHSRASVATCKKSKRWIALLSCRPDRFGCVRCAASRQLLQSILSAVSRLHCEYLHHPSRQTCHASTPDLPKRRSHTVLFDVTVIVPFLIHGESLPFLENSESRPSQAPWHRLDCPVTSKLHVLHFFRGHGDDVLGCHVSRIVDR